MNQAEVAKVVAALDEAAGELHSLNAYLDATKAGREFSCGLEFKDGSYIKSDQYRAYRERQDEIIALAAKIRREKEGQR